MTILVESSDLSPNHRASSFQGSWCSKWFSGIWKENITITTQIYFLISRSEEKEEKRNSVRRRSGGGERERGEGSRGRTRKGGWEKGREVVRGRKKSVNV